MKTSKLTTIAALLGLVMTSGIASCGNEDSTIGASIVNDNVTVTVDSSFTVAGQPVASTSVQSRTLLHILGRIDAKGYGSLSSDVVTQFMPSYTLDTTNVTVNDIDSVKLMLAVYHGNFVGDSITPMGIDVYRLKRDLPSPIYSNFDPQGYYDEQKMGSLIYNASTLGHSDSLRNANYHTLAVNLPREFGRELFSAYKSNPENFATPNAFINNVFKGLYIRNSYGSGRLTLVSSTMMRVFYHRHLKTDDGRDSVASAMANYLAVTPEVITNNNIGFKMSDNVRQAVDQGQPIVVSPIGYDVEFKFPIQDIISSYRGGKGSESAINSLTFNLPADSLSNDFKFGPAPYLLMVLKNKKQEFFANNSLPDNETSFYAQFDTTNRCYNFTSLRAYLLKMLDKAELTEDDYTFVLTPVNVTVETSGSYYYSSETVTNVTPYISAPTMTKILFDDAKIKLTYSNQTINY